MDIAFTEAQELLRSSARKFLENDIATTPLCVNDGGERRQEMTRNLLAIKIARNGVGSAYSLPDETRRQGIGLVRHDGFS